MIAVLTVLLFLLFNASATQRIYQSRYSALFTLLTLSAVAVAYFFNPYGEEKLVPWKVLSLFFFYTLLLFLIKSCYGKANAFLIRRHFIRARFANKDFTFIHFPFEYGNDYWDKKRASKPSWFDYLLTYALLLLPLLLMTAIV